MITIFYLAMAISLFAFVIGVFVFKASKAKKNASFLETKELIWPESFVRNREDYVHERFLNDPDCPVDAADIMDVLSKRGVVYERVCASEGFDSWFNNHLSVFCAHLAFLSHISRHSDLCMAFIKTLEASNSQNHLDLQKKLVSVWHHEVFDKYHLTCHYLLWYYLDKWDLAEEVRETIATDGRFADAWSMYQQKRGNA